MVEVMMWLSQLEHKRHRDFLLALSLGLLTLGEDSCHIRRMFRQPIKKPTWQGAEASCQEPYESSLGNESSSSSQTFS